jgi:hypothetical protein
LGFYSTYYSTVLHTSPDRPRPQKTKNKKNKNKNKNKNKLFHVQIKNPGELSNIELWSVTEVSEETGQGLNAGSILKPAAGRRNR